MNSFSDDELLCFGSILVNLAHHEGLVHQINLDSLDELRQHTDESEISIPFNIGKETLILPYLPIIPMKIPKANTQTSTLPSELCQPLIKTVLPSRLKGIVSGTRSALIKCDSSKWYRLKGCGNETEGFSIKSISDSNQRLTIRGCAFLSTTYRELFMTHYISRLLTSHKITCANAPVGWFEYQLQSRDTDKIVSDIPVIQDENLNKWPNVVRCCILMETFGNKRLSDHVLYGLEQIFPFIKSDEKYHVVNQSNLLSLFSSERLTKSERNSETCILLPTWFASLSSILQPIKYQDCDWLVKSAYVSNTIPEDIKDDRWRTLWKINIEIINNHLKNSKQSLSDLLCVLYKRFGFECGSILGLLHYNRISWGTYQDALGMHCNAHPNNLVIKLPFSLPSFFLAPLDFDMSFKEEHYAPNEFNNQSFDEILKLELSGFQLTLSGDPDASSGVTASLEMIDDHWTSGRWLLRDIMLNEFNTTYNDVIRNGTLKSVDLFSQQQNVTLQAIIRLALIKTVEEIA